MLIPMNTSKPSGNALRSFADEQSDASKASPENQPLAAKTQEEWASDLFSAIKQRDVDAVIRLAAKVDDLDRHMDHGDRPLMLAAGYDLPMAGLSFLLARSNPRLKRASGVTALMLAAWGNEEHAPELVRLLLPVSDPCAVNFGGESALHYAITAFFDFGSHATETIALLLPASDLAQTDSCGSTPLARARLLNHDAVANLILSEMARRESLELSSCTDSPALPPFPVNSRAPRL